MHTNGVCNLVSEVSTPALVLIFFSHRRSKTAYLYDKYRQSMRERERGSYQSSFGEGVNGQMNRTLYVSFGALAN